MTNSGIALGADVGGSHITAAQFHLQNKEIISSSWSRKSILPDAGVEELIAGWAECIRKAIGTANVEKICLAMPGPFDYEKGICLIKDQNKYPGLYGVNIKEKLSEALALQPADIYLHNDAACFLQGEVFCGSVMDAEAVIGVTLGTGLGTAVYNNGHAQSADLWNMPFLDSIAEDYISSRWFTSNYKLKTGRTVHGVKELAALAASDNVAMMLFNEFGKNLGLFLNSFLERSKSDAIVIGGNIANAYALFRNVLTETVQVKNPSLVIHQSVHGENAALIGAVSSWYTSNVVSLSHN